MPKDMPSAKFGPLAPLKSSLEVIMGLVTRHRTNCRSPRLTARNVEHVTERVLAAWMLGEPFREYQLQKRRYRYTASRRLIVRFFPLVNGDHVAGEIDVGHFRAEYFSPACPGVGCKNEHRVQKWL